MGNEFPNSVASGAGPGERNVPGEEAEDQEGAVSFGPAALDSLPETSECRSRGSYRETRDGNLLKIKAHFVLYFIDVKILFGNIIPRYFSFVN